MTHEKKARLVAVAGSWIVRALIATMRFRIVDRVGFFSGSAAPPLLWAFWHNRLFIIPSLYRHLCGDRPGAALTSASKDGEFVAAFLEQFGIRPIRGSSSRGGARALVEMKRAIEGGTFVGITPDGPRGPRYSLNPGVVKLAQITGRGFMPVHIRYARFWQLKTWDGFMIPRPFTTAHVTFDPLIEVAPTNDEAAFENERIRIERLLQPPEAGERTNAS